MSSWFCCVSVLGTDVEVYDDEVEGPCRLRTVRSADSLLNESRIDETSRAQAYNRFSDNTSDNTMFVNYYAGKCTQVIVLCRTHKL